MPNNTTKTDSKGFAIASMVCGICSIVFCAVFWVSIACAIVALTLGIIALVKKKAGKGMAIAGVATGGAGLIATIAVYMIALSTINAAVNTLNTIIDDDSYDWSSWYSD